MILREFEKRYAEIRKKYDIQILAELIMLYDEKYANKEKKVPVEYIYNELHDDLVYNSREKKKNYFGGTKNSKRAKLITDFVFLLPNYREKLIFVL